AAHELTGAMQRRGVCAYTLQHGLENVGISYFDAIQGPEVRFASDHVLIWGAKERLPTAAPAENRAKMESVGRPEYEPGSAPPAAAWPATAPTQFDVMVFENLHWHRFDDAYRTKALSDLQRLAETRPNLHVGVKPHPQGRWLTHRFKGPRPAAGNLFIADPADPAWSRIDAPAFLERTRAVLTTPSSIALDAAQRGIPVA